MRELKAEMRKAALAVRSAAHARSGRTAGDLLAAHGLGFASPPATGGVSGFLPIGEEINPLPLMLRMRAAGYTLALPTMEGKAKPLVFRVWGPEDEMREVKWGIREPLPTSLVVEPDVLLVPLLAFDAKGYRLGYGGGFYDRSLERLRAMKRIVAVGIGYDEQRVDSVPHAEYDQPLDWVLTPSGPLRCTP